MGSCPSAALIQCCALRLNNAKQLGFEYVSSQECEQEGQTMWGGIIGLIIQLVSGGVGGNIAGSLLKQFDLVL
jgi:hypothetical protein